MTPWRVEITDHALKDTESLPAKDLGPILRAIRLFARDPTSADVKKLQGQPDRWRLRLGDWRVLFIYKNEEHIVEIQAIKRRKDAYTR